MLNVFIRWMLFYQGRILVEIVGEVENIGGGATV
jgi:hypothetical protein